MNTLYATFLEKQDIYFPTMVESFLKYGDSVLAKQTSLDKFLNGYENDLYLTNDINICQTSYEDIIYFNGIRPVIKTDGLIKNFIDKYKISEDDNCINLGYYSQEIIDDENLIKKLNENVHAKTGNKYTLTIDNNFKTYDEFIYINERYIFISDENVYAKVTPLKWLYDENTNSLICKYKIANLFNKKRGEFQSEGTKFLNYYFLKEILQQYKITSIKEKVNIINDVIDKEITIFDTPYDSYLEIDEEGNLFSHDENEFNIVVNDEIYINEGAINHLKNKIFASPIFDIVINSKNIKVGNDAFNLKYLNNDSKIRSLIVNNKTKLINTGFSLDFPIEKVTIPCDMYLFISLYLSGKACAFNALLDSDLTIKYDNEKELTTFIMDIKKIIKLINKNILANQKKRKSKNKL